jgi:hypothetical protein
MAVISHTCERIRALALTGGDAIYIDDATATCDMISVAHYERFSLPYMREEVREIQALGKKAIVIYFGGVSDRIEQTRDELPGAARVRDAGRVEASRHKEAGQLRRLAEDEVAIRGEALRAVEQHFHLGRLKAGRAVDGIDHQGFKLVPVLLQQLELELDLIRAEMTYRDVPGGGALFAVGSISWTGSLSHKGYENNVARISTNVLRRFLS